MKGCLGNDYKYHHSEDQEAFTGYRKTKTRVEKGYMDYIITRKNAYRNHKSYRELRPPYTGDDT